VQKAEITEKNTTQRLGRQSTRLTSGRPFMSKQMDASSDKETGHQPRHSTEKLATVPDSGRSAGPVARLTEENLRRIGKPSPEKTQDVTMSHTAVHDSNTGITNKHAVPDNWQISARRGAKACVGERELRSLRIQKRIELMRKEVKDL